MTSLRRHQQAIRISLKEIESLMYNMSKADELTGLQTDLEKIKRKYTSSIPSEEGLTLRSFSKLNHCAVTARKLKLKYKRLRQRTTMYGSLLNQGKREAGRPRMNASFRNRVGRKAAKLCQVLRNYLFLSIACNLCTPN